MNIVRPFYLLKIKRSFIFSLIACILYNMTQNSISLMIHGGAGEVANKEEYLVSMRRVLLHGQKLLNAGISAFETVESCVVLLEDDSLFNAGYGSVLNEMGFVELDAAIMDGQSLNAGAVACVRNIKNPIKLARLILEKSEHVFLIGEGATAFGKLYGIELAVDSYFITDHRVRQLEEAKKRGKVVLDHSALSEDNQKKFGTVGAVARDINGNLAAASSTGGIVNKRFGRVGDTPVIGSGIYADNETCAVSATGYGEQFLRTVLAKTIADIVYYEKCSAQQAAEAGIAYLVKKVQGLGGIIIVDREGNTGSAFSTPGLARGWIHNGEIICALY